MHITYKYYVRTSLFKCMGESLKVQFCYNNYKMFCWLKFFFWKRVCRQEYSTESGTSRETCARHVRQAISPASLKLESYKLAWANPCPNPDHTPICSQIGKEMPEKSLVNWKFSNFLSFPSLCHIQPISAIFCPKEDSPRQLSHVGCTSIQAAQAIASREVHTTVFYCSAGSAVDYSYYSK